MKKKFILLIFPLLCAFFSMAGAQTSIKVPRGKSPMIDGHITQNEWRDAKSIEVSAAVRLHFKQAGEFVYICLDAPNQEYLTTDTYLATSGEIYNLHVSAMLGERTLKNGEFTAWDWWNNDGWTANAARILNTVEPKRFLPNQAIEFQISRRRFAGEKWLMKFDLGIPQPVIFPKETVSKNTSRWLTVEIGKSRV